MIVDISSDAEEDLIEGYWFYERQSPGLGDYFRSCLIADIESLAYYVEFMQSNTASTGRWQSDFHFASTTAGMKTSSPSWLF